MAAPFAAIPYVPGGASWLGHTPEFRRDRLGLTRRVADLTGPLHRLRSPFANILVTADPDTLHEVLVEKVAVFEKSEMLRFVLQPLVGEGLFTSRGELWRRQRRLMAPLFHPGALGAYGSDMVASAERAMATWPARGQVELARDTTRVTMAIAGRTLFDTDTFEETDALGSALTVALDFIAATGGSPFAFAHILARRRLEAWAAATSGGLQRGLKRAARKLEGPLALVGEHGARLRRVLPLLDERVGRMIEERRASGAARQDLLSRLLAARDDDDGATMNDKQVRDEVLTLFVAGHETTASALAWALYELSRHPDVYAAAEAEADALGGAPTSEDLSRLPLLLRIFKEALRLYPPVYFFGRTAREATTLGGYDVPRHAMVLVLPYAVHHRAAHFPEPERFVPERFLPAAEAGRHRLAWIPFGAGPRVCIGNQFALMEGQLVLAAMLRRFRFSAAADDTPLAGATLRPRHGVRLTVEARA